jgi:hypothetical protein
MNHSFILNGPQLWQEDSFLHLHPYYQLAEQHDMDIYVKADLKAHYQLIS